MKLKKLVLNKWCQHDSLEIDFHPGMNGIIGSNGRGKSNVLRAIRRVLGGAYATSIGVKEDDLMWGADKGSILLEFDVDGSLASLLRSISSSHARLMVGDEVYKKSVDIDEHMNRILGVNSKVLQDVVFVEQGAVTDIIFKRPADRAKTLYALLGLDEAERIRGYLTDRVALFSTESVEELLNAAKGRASSLQLSVDKAVAASKELCAKTMPDKDFLRGVVSRWDVKKSLQESLVSLRKSKDDGHYELAGLYGVRGAAKMRVDDLKSSLESPGMKEAYEFAKLQYSQAQETIKAKAAYDVALAKLPAIQQATREAEPLTETDEALLQKVISDLAAAKAMYDQIPDFSTLIGQPTCPVCLSSLDPDRVRRLVSAKSEALFAYNGLVSELNRLQALHEAERLALSRHAQRVKAAEVELAKLQSVVSRGDPGTVDVDKLFELINTYDNLQKQLTAAERELTEALAKIDSLKASLEATAKTIADSEAKMDPNVTQEQADAAKAQLEEVGKHELAVASLNSSLNTLVKELTSAQEEVKRLEAKSASQDKVRACRDLFERAKGVLHRDQLPNVAAQRFISAINAGMNRQLEMFEADFTAEIKSDLSFECRFSDKPAMSADRLSGGQKVALALSLRFALHDLFASKLGLMVLDEPSVFLDNERISALYSLLERFKAHAHAQGLQFLMVTHEQKLKGVFDKVIAL